MEEFNEFLDSIDNFDHRSQTEAVLQWVGKTFPQLTPTVKWNQPMFTDHGTYIIGFSVSQKHLAAAPEQAGIAQFMDEIQQAGYDHTKEIIRFPWNKSVDYTLLQQIIAFNIQDKADCQTFWR